MTQGENQKDKNAHDVSIAIMQKDIEYIKNSMSKIETTLSIFDRNFARKDELKETERLLREQEKEFKAFIVDIKSTIEKGMRSKVDKEEFEPFKRTAQKINWMLIAAVIGALLNIIIKTQ